MGKKTAGVVGALGAIAAGAVLPAAATAAPTPAVAPAQSYADLLKPIPNAVERLARSNAEEVQAVRLAQAAGQPHHHAQAGSAHHAQTPAQHHAQTPAHHHHAQAPAHHHHAQAAPKAK